MSWGEGMLELGGRVVLLLMLLTFALCAGAQVFTVGERSATADIKTDFTPTHVELEQGKLTERGGRELLRDLVGEQGFAHRVLPLATVVTLRANGPLVPASEQYKKMVYEKGSAAQPGDRVAVTSLEIKGDELWVDLNGGPYLKHRFLRHISINGADPASADGAQATGMRVALKFEGGVPEITAPEVKALLEPVIDFKVKRSEIAYADTLPVPVKGAIASHEVLVGMNHRMVLASLGAPENKVRETVDGRRYEEWIYGHQPQTMKFVRFSGDRVSQVKIAAMGKAIEVHDQDELAGYLPAAPTREIALGDAKNPDAKATAPSLMKPGEKAEAPEGQAQGRVIIPEETPAKPATDSVPAVVAPPAGNYPANPKGPQNLMPAPATR